MIHYRRATVVCLVVFFALSAWTIATADDRSDALVSVFLVGVPILAVVVGVLWVIHRTRTTNRSR